jgi:hypothetical protein
MKYLSLVLAILFAQISLAQQSYPPPTACPVLSSLASSKVRSTDPNDKSENIVIWFWDQGKKTAHGVEFHLYMLDTAGNRYPASQSYQVKGDVKPQNGDVVIYPTKDEQQFFGDKWDRIEGIEVHVTKILFADATAWSPAKGVDCKTVFLNDNYEKEMGRRDKAVEKNMEVWRKKWNQQHPDHPLPDLKDDNGNSKP